jgi:hypothetical protein
MSVSQYEKDGKVFWRVYLDLRSRRHPGARVQRRVNGIESEKEALAEEKRLLRELTSELARLESLGLRWGEVVDRWEDQPEATPSPPSWIMSHFCETGLIRGSIGWRPS